MARSRELVQNVVDMDTDIMHVRGGEDAAAFAGDDVVLVLVNKVEVYLDVNNAGGVTERGTYGAGCGGLQRR